MLIKLQTYQKGERMINKYSIRTFTDVQVLHEQAKKCPLTVLAFDAKGSCADAKSILGLMCLSYVDPVSIESESKDFFDRLPFEKS